MAPCCRALWAAGMAFRTFKAVGHISLMASTCSSAKLLLLLLLVSPGAMVAQVDAAAAAGAAAAPLLYQPACAQVAQCFVNFPTDFQVTLLKLLQHLNLETAGRAAMKIQGNDGKDCVWGPQPTHISAADWHARLQVHRNN